MPRSARLDIPGLLQHVIVRGVDRCDIFRDDRDRRRFLESFSRLLVKTGTVCLAWALMSNHFHLLLRPRRSRLAPFMRRLLTGYALYFNLRHKRSGHLFQNRYKSIVCEEDAYLLELVRYIHLNPLRAGLVPDAAALDVYPWSGHSVIAGESTLEGQSVDEVLSLFASTAAEGLRRYRSFVVDGIKLGKRRELGSDRRMTAELLEALGPVPYDPRILGSGDFIAELREHSDPAGEMSPSTGIEEIAEKVCRRFGIDPAELKQNSRSADIVTARSAICYLAVREAEKLAGRTCIIAL